MSQNIKIALAGLGTVGGGVVSLLAMHGEMLARRCGRRFEIIGVSARDKNKPREIDIPEGSVWFESATDLARMEGIELFIETIGGSDGIALEAVKIALGRGISVVTANKAMLAKHGVALASLAESTGAALLCEAAVAGGIPILKALKEGLVADSVTELHGILNGTCNYILTAMRGNGQGEGQDFDTALADAQHLGYAEAEPAFDIDGHDAAQKLAILAAIAFGQQPDYDGVHIQGIRGLSQLDMVYAEQLGFRLKLLGIARRTAAGIEQRVHPTLVPVAAPIAAVDGVFNAVSLSAEPLGRQVYVGRGAGAGPTASAVIADMVDWVRGLSVPTFGVPVAALQPPKRATLADRVGCYYLRLMVLDRPGVIADISAILRDNAISLETMLQRGRSPGKSVPVILTTHECREAAMLAALQQIEALPSLQEKPCMIRIENY